MSDEEAGTAEAEVSEGAFLAALDRVRASRPGLGEIESGILAALDLGLPGDSRAFARAFAVEHALVLRALTGLEETGAVTVTGRDARTRRTRYAPRSA